MFSGSAGDSYHILWSRAGSYELFDSSVCRIAGTVKKKRSMLHLIPAYTRYGGLVGGAPPMFLPIEHSNFTDLVSPDCTTNDVGTPSSSDMPK